jgi:hypothetical protein
MLGAGMPPGQQHKQGQAPGVSNIVDNSDMTVLRMLMQMAHGKTCFPDS